MQNDRERPGGFRLKLLFPLFFLLMVLVFVAIEVTISRGTELSIGNYGRYLDVLWANSILDNGRVLSQPFPNNPSLFSNANSYAFNLLPAIILAETHLLTGLQVTVVQRWPVLGVAYLASVYLAALSLYSGSRRSATIAVILSCFFVYTNNIVSSEITRVVLSQFVFNMFVYTFTKRSSPTALRFRSLGIFFLMYFVFTYSSNAVVGIVLVGTFLFLEAREGRPSRWLNLTLVYVTSCLTYYLLMTSFLTAGLLQFKNVFEARGLSFQFYLLNRLSGWPSQLQYIPNYSVLDLVFLAYPFAVLAILVTYAFSSRVLGRRRPRLTSSYDHLLVSFLFFLIVVVGVNSWALFPTAGLDYVIIFGWLAPLLAVDPFERLLEMLKERLSGRTVVSIQNASSSTQPVSSAETTGRYSSVDLVRLALVVAVVLIGTIGIFYYQGLEPREGERVTGAEIATTEWLVNQGVIVTSDLHFLSTYVTIGGSRAVHFLPLEFNTINETYYNVNLTSVQRNGANSFVVTRSMTSLYIANFDGSRTIANRLLDEAVGKRWNRVYDNGEDRVYVVSSP